MSCPYLKIIKHLTRNDHKCNVNGRDIPTDYVNNYCLRSSNTRTYPGYTKCPYYKCKGPGF